MCNRSDQTLLLLMISCLMLQCWQTPWGAQATRLHPPYKGGDGGNGRGGNGGGNDPDRPQTGPVTPAPNGDITMASPTVLTDSLLAARLSNLAYPSSLLNDDDTMASYLDPAKFQLYTAALKKATSDLTNYDIAFVQRLAYGDFTSLLASSRFIYAFIMAIPAKSAVYVAFRGTDTTGVGYILYPYSSTNSLASIGVDGNSKQIPVQAGNVHTGFYITLTETGTTMYNNQSLTTNTNAYTDIKKAIQAAQAKVGGSSAPVVLTGHSLGAAHAALMAFMLNSDGFTNLSLYTFGMPQVGDQAWRAAFDTALGGQHYRWWNKQDPIIQYPNSYIDPGCTGIINRCTQNWYTVDTLYRIANLANGTLRCGTPTGSFRVCDERANTPSPQNEQSCYADIDWQQIWDEPDHSILNYISNLQACSQGTNGNVGGNVGGNIGNGGSNVSNGCKRGRGRKRGNKCRDNGNGNGK